MNAARRSLAPPKSERGENPFDLLRVGVQRAVGPDDKIGAGDFLFDGHLGGGALPDLFRHPAARQQTFTLGGGGAGRA